MILDLIVTKTDDGFDAKVPSLNEAETWAHTEEEAIDKILDILVFFLNIEEKKEIKNIKARNEKNKTIYKLVFHKR